MLSVLHIKAFVELQKAKMFCILDLPSAYQQVVFEKINKDLTVFIT